MGGGGLPPGEATITSQNKEANRAMKKQHTLKANQEMPQKG